MMESLDFLDAHTLCGLISTREVSPVAVMQHALERLDQVEPGLNSFAAVDVDLAMQQARQVEKHLQAGEAVGKLAGLPVSVKDLVAVKGLPLRLGSKTSSKALAGEDAVAVARLRRAGACILGKTTTSEYGCKAVGDSPLTGVTRNPWNPARTSGGSSAGAAASVAAGVTPVGIGTDGAGSVRIPAALTGLFGIKPQFGRIPVFPPGGAPSLFHLGSLSRTVRDSALILEVMAGFDERDPGSMSAAVPGFRQACEQGIASMRIAWSPALGFARPDPEILAITQKAVGVLAELGARVEEVGQVMDDPIRIWETEFYTNVGARLSDFLKDSPEQMDMAVVKKLREAMQSSLPDYHRNSASRARFREQIRQFFQHFDLLITPTLPVAAFDTGLDVPPQLAERDLMSWVYYTYPFNLTGQPAASVPCGFTGEGLPVGMQMVAPTNQETTIFRAATAFESARPWACRWPEWPVRY